MSITDKSARAAVTAKDSAANQAPPLVNYNLFLSDPVLTAAVQREGAAWAKPQLTELGQFLGTDEVQRWGFDANENPPVLHTHDRQGNRRDEVVFHPSWHNLMRASVERRLHCLPWTEKREGGHVARAAMLLLTVQNEAGHTCPVSMTFSCLATLRNEPKLAREWEPRIVTAHYDPRFMPAEEKTGVLVGMAMTEKQGGSDVRANTTVAEPAGAAGEYQITGHKWFCSAPMCDAFLVLAQTAKGLTCFLLPRWTPDGEKNRFFIQRLKDKLGNRSNASSEVEFDQAWARRVGEEGGGVNAIIEMVNHTRLDCAVASAGLMRQALAQAVHHARHRKAFGKLLIDQPLMRNLLADLALESEAATLLAMRLAHGFDRRENDPRERLFCRMVTAVAKYWLCKRSPSVVNEALECLGGNGYVEESMMPRLYREAPLYSIWEGSGNVMALDILRALKREPDAAGVLLDELKQAAGADSALQRYGAGVEKDMRAHLKKGDPGESESQARRLAERLALALQASLMVRHGSSQAADAFVESRINGDHGCNFGTLSTKVDISGVLNAVLDGAQ